MASESFKKEFLDCHNKYRSMHNVGPLTYNKDMCAEAQEWANYLLATKCMRHSETKDGENIFCIQGCELRTITGNKAVDSWYNEINDYSFSSPGHQRGTVALISATAVPAAWSKADHKDIITVERHFTQVVWKESTELGLGVASNDRITFVVGQYRPAGNITNVGYFLRNVLPKVK